FEFNQVIFYDTTRAADDGNCEFTVQYLTAAGMSSSTVGAQDPARASFIQVLFDGAYHRGASTMAAGRAIKYTTDAPTTGLAEPGIGSAARFDRLAVAPNPVRSGAMVRFGVRQAGNVRLAVFDRAGRAVRTLANGPMTAGQHSVRWDGRDDSGRTLAQGVYFLRLDTGTERTSLKAVLLD
ncbi:MAG: FlgD immunoglobulin-like domain containing protein, partial [bacterium]